MALGILTALAIGSCSVPPPHSRVVSYGENMTPITEVTDRHALMEFQRLLQDRQAVRGTWRAYAFTHVFDVFTGGQSVRWIYGPDGYCFIQGTIDSDGSTVYKVRDNSRLNQIIGVEQVGASQCYTHLGRFLRGAPPVQIDSFWQAVGRAMKQRVSASPVWLSTAGMGVSWLHLRLDSRPKYYRHQPYKTHA